MRKSEKNSPTGDNISLARLSAGNSASYESSKSSRKQSFDSNFSKAPSIIGTTICCKCDLTWKSFSFLSFTVLTILSSIFIYLYIKLYNKHNASHLPDSLEIDVTCPELDPDTKVIIQDIPKSKIDENNILITIVVPTYTPRHKFHENLYSTFLSQSWLKYEQIPTWNETQIEMLVYENWFSKNKEEKPYPSTFFMKPENLDEEGYFKDRRVKYKFFNYSVTIGEKRNLMTKAAKGKYVVHMDDDDFYEDTYIANSISTLLSYSNKTILVIRLKHLQCDITWNSKLQKIDESYFYIVSRPNNEDWAFAWVYHNKPLQDTKCKYSNVNLAEEGQMATCLEEKKPGSIIRQQKLANSFVKVDTGYSTTSHGRPSQHASNSKLIKMSVKHASEVNVLMDGHDGYCALTNHITSNLKTSSN